MSPSAILLGSKPGAVAALSFLVEDGWDVRAVVRSESEASWLPRPTLHEEAKKLGIPSVSDQADLATVGKVDLVISYMCRVRVSAETRNLGKYAVNFHAGPLPEYAGWAFYSLAILDDSPLYGCTCHIMDNGFDTGAVVEVRHFSVDIGNETALSLERKAQIEMVHLFREIIARYQESGELKTEAQDMAKFRYLNRMSFELLKRIPADASGEQADRIARAFWYPPYEIAYYQLPSGDRVEVVPKIAKQALAPQLHSADLGVLLEAGSQAKQVRLSSDAEVDRG